MLVENFVGHAIFDIIEPMIFKNISYIGGCLKDFLLLFFISVIVIVIKR